MTSETVVHTIELRVRLVLEVVPVIAQLPATVTAAPAEVAPVAGPEATESPAEPVSAPSEPRAKPEAAAGLTADASPMPTVAGSPISKGGAAKGSAFSAEARERALLAYGEGLSLRAVERLTGVNPTTIRRWLRQAGRPARPRGRQTGTRRPAPAGAVPPAPPAEVATRPEPPAPVAERPSAALPLARPPNADDAAIAAALAAGRVTRLPDAAAFAKLPAIADAATARTVLEGAGVQVRRAGVGWEVDGRKLDHGGLLQAAQAAQRQALLQGGASGR